MGEQRHTANTTCSFMLESKLATSPCLGRWQVKPSAGAVLTVSVANPQAGQSGA